MNKIFIIGAVLVLIGAILPIFQIHVDGIQVAPFVLSLGVIGVLVGRYMQPIKGDDTRIKRLRFQQVVSSCALVASAYLMFVEDRRWVLALFVAATIDLIISYRMPKEK